MSYSSPNIYCKGRITTGNYKLGLLVITQKKKRFFQYFSIVFSQSFFLSVLFCPCKNACNFPWIWKERINKVDINSFHMKSGFSCRIQIREKWKRHQIVWILLNLVQFIVNIQIRVENKSLWGKKIRFRIEVSNLQKKKKL